MHETVCDVTCPDLSVSHRGSCLYACEKLESPVIGKERMEQ